MLRNAIYEMMGFDPNMYGRDVLESYIASQSFLGSMASDYCNEVGKLRDLTRWQR